MHTVILYKSLHSHRPRRIAYALPLVITLLALVLRAVLAPVLGELAPLLVFIMPVILSAWYGGFGPGMFATVFTTLVGVYFFIPPRFSFMLPSVAQAVQVAIFVCEGVLISVLLQLFHNSRKQTEASNRTLIESEERFRLLVESVSDYAIFMLDPDGRIMSWNLGAERIKGYRPSEILGHHFAVFYKSEDRAQGLPQAHLKAARTQGRLQYQGERLRKDGTLFWAEVLITVLHNDVGKLVGFTKITRDLTERKAAEQHLRTSEERYRTVMEAVPQMVWILQSDGSISFANQTWAEYTGLPRVLRNAAWTEVVHPLDQGRLHEYWHDVVQGNHEGHVEVRIKRVDGAYRWHLARLVPITNDNQDSRAWLGNATDVHDLKRAETEVRQVNASLEQRVLVRTRQLADVNAELEHFAYSVAHDLRAPLRGMHGLAHALHEDYADLIDADGQEYLRHMIVAAEHMDKLIQDLLAYSRLGRAELVLQTVPLDVVVREARTQIATEIKQRHAELRVVGELPLVCAHHQTLVQVVSNLLSNAIKFVPNNATPCIEVTAEMDRSWVRLWIIDNGIGIASEHHQRIWNVFERLHGTEAYPGTGIGLAIVRKGIERMGGNVGVESQLNAGSRFWIELSHPEEE